MSKKQNFGLGRGLDALIGAASDYSPAMKAAGLTETQQAAETDILNVPVSRIDANPYQPRQNFDETALEELADSIRTLGLIQPITLRRNGDRFQIISGERRYRASVMAGLKSVPAYIRTADDKGMLEMAIVENIQRENLDAIEVAVSLQRLIDECDLTQEQMADRIGKKRATVSNYIRLLRLPAEIQLALKAGRLSMGHARAILAVEDESDQIMLCNAVIEKDLSVRQLEQRIRNMLKAREEASEDSASHDGKDEIPEHFYKVADILGKYFDNNISLKRTEKGSGSITIRFSSDEEVERFLRRMEDTDL